MAWLSKLFGLRGHRVKHASLPHFQPSRKQADLLPKTALATADTLQSAPAAQVPTRLATSEAHPTATPPAVGLWDILCLLDAEFNHENDRKSLELTHALQHLLQMFQYASSSRVLFSPQHPPAPPWLMKMLTDTHALADDLRHANLRRGHANAKRLGQTRVRWTQRLAKRIGALKPKQRILVPIGPINQGRIAPSKVMNKFRKSVRRAIGHTSLWEILRQQDGKFSLRVYGASHPAESVEPKFSRADDGKLMQAPALKFRDISPDAWGTPDAPGPMLLAVGEYWFNKRDKMDRAASAFRRELFDTLLPNFITDYGAVASDDVTAMSVPTHRRDPWELLLTVVRQHLPLRAYKRLKLELYRGHVLAACKMVGQLDADEAAKLNPWIDRALRNAHGALVKAVDAGHVTPAEATQWSTLLTVAEPHARPAPRATQKEAAHETSTPFKFNWGGLPKHEKDAKVVFSAPLPPFKLHAATSGADLLQQMQGLRDYLTSAPNDALADYYGIQLERAVIKWCEAAHPPTDFLQVEGDWAGSLLALAERYFYLGYAGQPEAAPRLLSMMLVMGAWAERFVWHSLQLPPSMRVGWEACLTTLNGLETRVVSHPRTAGFLRLAQQWVGAASDAPGTTVIPLKGGFMPDDVVRRLIDTGCVHPKLLAGLSAEQRAHRRYFSIVDRLLFEKLGDEHAWTAKGLHVSRLLQHMLLCRLAQKLAAGRSFTTLEGVQRPPRLTLKGYKHKLHVNGVPAHGDKKILNAIKCAENPDRERTPPRPDNEQLLSTECQRSEEIAAKSLLHRHMLLEPSWALSHFTTHLAELRFEGTRDQLSRLLLRRNWSAFAVDDRGRGVQNHVGSVFARVAHNNPDLVTQLNVFFDRASAFFFVLHDTKTLVHLCEMQQQLRGLCVAEGVRPLPTDPGPTLERMLREMNPDPTVRDNANALWMRSLANIEKPSTATLVRCLLTALASGNAEGTPLVAYLPRIEELLHDPSFMTSLSDGLNAFLLRHSLRQNPVTWTGDFPNLRAGALSFAFPTARLYIKDRPLRRIPLETPSYLSPTPRSELGFGTQVGDIITSADGTLRFNQYGQICQRLIRCDGHVLWFVPQDPGSSKKNFLGFMMSGRWGASHGSKWYVADADGNLMFKTDWQQSCDSLTCIAAERLHWTVRGKAALPDAVRERLKEVDTEVWFDPQGHLREIKTRDTEIFVVEGRRKLCWAQDPDFVVQPDEVLTGLSGVSAIVMRNSQGMRKALLPQAYLTVVDLDDDDALLPRSRSQAGHVQELLRAANHVRGAYEVLRKSQFLPGTRCAWYDSDGGFGHAQGGPETVALNALTACINLDAQPWDRADEGARGHAWTLYNALRTDIPAAMRMPLVQERRWLSGEQSPWGRARAQWLGATARSWTENTAPYAFRDYLSRPRARDPLTAHASDGAQNVLEQRTKHPAKAWNTRVHRLTNAAAYAPVFRQDLAAVSAKVTDPATVRNVQRRLHLFSQRPTGADEDWNSSRSTEQIFMMQEVLRQVMQNPALRPLARAALKHANPQSATALLTTMAPVQMPPYHMAHRAPALAAARPFEHVALPAPDRGLPRLTQTWVRSPVPHIQILQHDVVAHPPMLPLGVRPGCAVTAEVMREFDDHAAQPSASKRTLWAADTNLHGVSAEVQRTIKADRSRAWRARIEQKALQIHGMDAAAKRTARVRHSNEAPDLSYPRLVQAFARGQLSDILRANPTLDQQAVADIYSDIRTGLLEAARVQQARRVDALLQRMFAADTAKDAAAAALHRQAAADMLAAERCYDVDQYPHLLVFEVGSNILLRKNQVEALHTLLDGGNAVLQLPMGSGKTKVLLPLLAFGHHQRDRLPVVLVPTALLPTCLNDLSAACGILEQRVVHFSFSRNTSCSAEKMTALYRFLDDAHERGSCILATKEAFQALHLRYYEALQAGAGRLVTEPMGQALALLGERAVAIVDEADTAFDTRKELVFARGRGRPLSDEILDMVVKMYAYLCADGDVLSLQANGQSGKGPAVVTRAVTDAVQQVVRELSGFAEHLSADEQQAMLRYMAEPTMPRPAALKRLYDNETTRALAWALAVMREEATHLLPLTLRRNGAEHYGLLEQTPLSVSIPYSKGQAQADSLFGNDYEAVNFTIQSYLHRQPGIGPHDLFAVVQDMRRQVTQALERESLNPEETRAAQRWRALCGDLRELATMDAMFSITSAADARLLALRDYLHQDPRRVLAFVRQYVLEGITQTSSRMAQNAHDLCAMFGMVTGFTGTPWNRRTYPRGFITTVSPDTDQITKRLLMDATRTKVVPVTSAGVATVLESVAAQRPLDKLRALIDCGALLRGRDSKDVAADLRAFFNARPQSGVKAVMYFESDDDALMLWPLGDKVPQALSGSDRTTLARAGYRGEDIFAYYDQAHAIGSDLPLAPDAIGMVTMGEVTTLRDLQQGALRLRELTAGQRCDVVYPAALAPNIAATGAPDMASILGFVAANQGEFLAADKVQSIIQRMRREVMQQLDQICAERPPEGRAVFFFCVQALVTQLTETDPFKLFGDTRRVRTDLVLRHAVHSLQRTLDVCIAQLQAAEDNAAEVLRHIRDQLAESCRLQAHTAAIGALPTYQTRRSVEDSTVGQEVQREMSLAREQVCEEVPADEGQVAAAPATPFVVETFVAQNLPVTLDNNLGTTRDFMKTREGPPHDLLTHFQKPLTYVWVRPAEAGPKFVALSFDEAEACIKHDDTSPLVDATQPMALCNQHGQVITQGATPLPPFYTETSEALRAFALLKALHQVRSRSLPLSNRERDLLAAWREERPAERGARVKLLEGLRL